MSDIITERSGNVLRIQLNREQLERAVKLELQEFSERVRSDEAKEAFTAFVEKRKSNFNAMAQQTTRAA